VWPWCARVCRKRADYLRRIELIQDLEFKVAATQIKISRDGKYVLASGAPAMWLLWLAGLAAFLLAWDLQVL